jgi:hypothetical protein
MSASLIRGWLAETTLLLARNISANLFPIAESASMSAAAWATEEPKPRPITRMSFNKPHRPNEVETSFRLNFQPLWN